MLYSAPTMGSAGGAASSGLSSLEPVSSVKSPWTCNKVSKVGNEVSLGWWQVQEIIVCRHIRHLQNKLCIPRSLGSVPQAPAWGKLSSPYLPNPLGLQCYCIRTGQKRIEADYTMLAMKAFEVWRSMSKC